MDIIIVDENGAEVGRVEGLGTYDLSEPLAQGDLITRIRAILDNS